VFDRREPLDSHAPSPQPSPGGRGGNAITLRRRALSSLTAFSTVLLIVAAALWVRTFFADERVWVLKGRGAQQVWSVLDLRWNGTFAHAMFVRTDDTTSYRLHPAPVGWTFADIEVLSETYPPSPQGVSAWAWWDHYVDDQSGSVPPGSRAEVWRLQFRPWLPIPPLAVLPALWLWRFILARRKRRHGLCLVCGYDLRATPGRCPECGTEWARPHTGTPNRSQNVSATSVKSGIM
jgi:hypothetical protein